MNNYNYHSTQPLGMAAAMYENSRGEQIRVTDATFAENLSMLAQLENAPTNGITLLRPQQDSSTPVTVSPIPLQQPCQGSNVVRPMVLTAPPMALLNELCTKNQLVMKSEVIHEGPVHDRIFECFLKVSPNDETKALEVSASGKGRTKKDAKHEAAKALLLKMDPRLENMLSYNPAQPKPQAPAPPASDVKCTGNPIGDLNNLCMQLRFPPPVYEDLVDESHGSCANPIFKIACRLHQKIYDIGQGSSKKQAKKESAAKVLEKLRQVMEEPDTASAVFPDGVQDELCRRLAAFTLSKEKASKDSHSQSSSPKNLVETLTSFKARKGEKLDKLMMLKQVDFQKSDHALILDEVAMEQNIKLEFLDFSPHLDETRHKSMLSMVIDDAYLIFVGNGNNTAAARKAASFNGLEYFRLAYRYN